MEDQVRKMKTMPTDFYYLDNVQLQEHVDCRANFVFETVHLKVHAFEDYLSAAGVGNLLENGGRLRMVQVCRRREKNVELRRQKPERSNIKLASLCSAKLDI